MRKLLAALFLIAYPASAIEVTIPHEFTPATTAQSSQVNANFDAVEAGIEADETFYAESYASGSSSGGIVEAYNACVTAGGGTVMVPQGSTAINGSSFTGDFLLIDDGEACNISGYGSDGTDGAALQGGSILAFTNTAGLDIFDIQTSGVTISHLAITVASANSTTRGIVCGETNNVRIEDVLIDSDGTAGTGAGVGIDMYRCLKASVSDSETQNFAIGLRMDSYSNATSIGDSRFRQGGLGIHLAGTDGAVADAITIDTPTIEGNERGILFDGDSTFNVTLVDPHMEQDTGTLGSRYGIRVENGGARLTILGGTFGGTMNDNTDIIRSAGSALFAPDVAIGTRFTHGLDYSAANASMRIIDSKFVADAVGGVFAGADLYHPTDCETRIVSYLGSVVGTTCAEPDGDIWQCRDVDHASGTLDGVCDHAAEVELISGPSFTLALGTNTTGNYVDNVTGDSEIVVTHTPAEGSEPALSLAAGMTRDSELSAYTTGTSTPTDGSTACNTGDMHLETDAFKIYFCVDGSTDDWYGVAITDTP